MKENLLVNISRMIYNRKFYYCIVGMTATLYLSGLSYIKIYEQSADLDNCLAIVASSGFIILFYILCVIGGGLDFCEDYKTCYIKYISIRKGIPSYAKAKVISSALSGFLSMFFSLFLFEILMIITLWMYKGSLHGVFSGNINYTIQNQWDLLIFCLLGSLLSVVALLVTTFIPNVFVGTATPIILYYIILTLSNKYGTMGYFLPGCVYFGFSQLFESRVKHFLYALCYTGCILYFCLIIISKQIKRRMNNA